MTFASRALWIFGMASVVLLAAMIAGCDQQSDEPDAQSKTHVTRTVVQAVSIAPLAANRRTHAAVDSVGNHFWSQESEKDEDLLFVSGEADIPRATQLDVTRILAELKEPGGRGHIQSLAILAGDTDRVFFYFAGGKGRKIIAALGIYSLRWHQVKILADTRAIERLTGMGASLDLARASLFPAWPIGDVATTRPSSAPDARRDIPLSRMYLWIRHTDKWLLIGFDGAAAAAGDKFDFRTVLTSARSPERVLRLNTDTEDLGPGPAGTLLYLDRHDNLIWSIDPATSAETNARLVSNLAGIPPTVTLPSFDHNGLLYLLAAKTEKALTMDTPCPFKLPAMVILDGDKMSGFGADDIILPSGMQLPAMQPAFLTPSRLTKTWLCYDAASGMLLSLKFDKR